MVCGLYVREHTKAQLTVFLVSKRLRRRGHGLESHPSDLESRRGSELGTPVVYPALHHGGLQSVVQATLSCETYILRYILAQYTPKYMILSNQLLNISAVVRVSFSGPS